MCGTFGNRQLHAKIGGTSWESGTFLQDDKPSQSHSGAGMLGKHRREGWDKQRGAGGGGGGVSLSPHHDPPSRPPNRNPYPRLCSPPPHSPLLTTAAGSLQLLSCI
uniref:Uncharacterized protein n=1 Tax=Knipowitschia caucasica TaxID=637954 RepID=A0AAV2LP51_KNICA